MEEQLRQIWANVLALEPSEIGVEDHLFSLGGDSVKAILIIARAAEHQLYFDIKTLYANPTIGTLAKAIDQIQTINDNVAPASIRVENNPEAASDGDLLRRVRHRMEGLGIPQPRVLQASEMRDDQVDFIEMTSQGAIGASPTFLYQVDGTELPEKLQRAITLVTAKHPILRTTFVDVDSKHYQVLLADASVPLYQRSGGIEEHVHEASTQVLAAGDPTAYYTLIEGQGKLLFFSFSVLHCFFDSFSRNIIERDLLAALESPEAFALQPERPWYGDFARHLSTNLDEAEAEAFWARYLADSRLDTIYQGSAPGPKRRFDRSLYRTPSTTAASSVALQDRHIHLATAITTAWALALMRRSGCSDVAFTVLTLGRLYPYQGIDQLVGLLVKDRPFRLHVQDCAAATLDSVLQGVQEDLVSASEYEHGNQRFPGGRRMQSYVNIKLGGSAMEKTVIDGLTITPRRDLERWESESQYAVYLEMKPVVDGNRFEMRYHSSLINDEHAAGLLERFMELLERISASPATTTVASLVEETGTGRGWA